jgi:hypothetical protein
LSTYYELGGVSSPFVETDFGGGCGLGGSTVTLANSKFNGSIVRDCDSNGAEGPRNHDGDGPHRV